MSGDRDEKLKRAEAESNLSAYRAKLAKGNYREMAKVVSKVKAMLKGVSTYFKCTYTLEGGRITIDFKRRTKEIISAYYNKDEIEKAFCCIKQPIGLRPIRLIINYHPYRFVLYTYTAQNLPNF